MTFVTMIHEMSCMARGGAILTLSLQSSAMNCHSHKLILDHNGTGVCANIKGYLLFIKVNLIGQVFYGILQLISNSVLTNLQGDYNVGH